MLCLIRGAPVAAHVYSVALGLPSLHVCWSHRAVHHPLGAAGSVLRLAGVPRRVWACTGVHSLLLAPLCWAPCGPGQPSHSALMERAPGPRGVTLLGGALGGHLGMARPLTAT